MLVFALEFVVVAVVIFVVAAYAVGRIGPMTDAPRDAADNGLPEGRLSGRDIDATRFGLVLRGYRMSEVDAVLDRLRDELAARDADLAAARGETPESPESSADPDAPRPRPTPYARARRSRQSADDLAAMGDEQGSPAS